VPRQELITTDIINQIESWVDAGLSPKAIAEKIGCTLGTLKVRCAQLRISLRRKTHVAMRGPRFLNFENFPDATVQEQRC